MSTRDSSGGKGSRCVRLTTYYPCSAERQEIRGFNLRGPPWAISTACCGRDLYLYIYIYTGQYLRFYDRFFQTIYNSLLINKHIIGFYDIL